MLRYISYDEGWQHSEVLYPLPKIASVLGFSSFLACIYISQCFRRECVFLINFHRPIPNPAVRVRPLAFNRLIVAGPNWWKWRWISRLYTWEDCFGCYSKDQPSGLHQNKFFDLCCFCNIYGTQPGCIIAEIRGMRIKSNHCCIDILIQPRWMQMVAI